MTTGSTPASSEPAWVADVLRFWFEELAVADWFRKSDATDALIRARFLTLYDQLSAADGVSASTPREMLATVIVLDQFSRNMFRNSARAFAADPIARQISRAAIDQGLDSTMSDRERIFLYLPFEHSEDRDDQALCLGLVQRLGNEQWTRYALAHKQIIDRFGRFPHRNAVLGRVSTADELELLKDPAGSF